MDRSFAQAVAAWTDFYAYTGTAAATLLGLLFVAVSLRTGIFRAAEVADVRDEAVYTFGTFLALMLVAGVFLVPDQRPAGVAVPLALLGALGLAGLGRVFRQWRRLNPGTALPGVWKAYFAASALAYGGLLGAAGPLLAGRTQALSWLVLSDVTLLTTATISAWILLSHAGPDPGAG